MHLLKLLQQHRAKGEMNEFARRLQLANSTFTGRRHDGIVQRRELWSLPMNQRVNRWVNYQLVLICAVLCDDELTVRAFAGVVYSFVL